MDINIRNVKYEDLPAVVDIQVDSWKDTYKGIIDGGYLKNLNKHERLEKRKKDYQQNGFIVAEKNGEILGFCRFVENINNEDYNKCDCELGALYIRIDSKGKCIGKQLINYVKKYFKEKNKTKMILWCLEENYNSRAFYEKMGGKLIGKRQIEIGNRTYDEVAYGYDLK